MILVTGGTGNVGREVVAELLSRSEPVRVFTRDAAKAARWGEDVHIAVGDLTHQGSVQAALSGVRGVFLMSTGDAVEPVARFAEAVREAGGARVVFLSTLYAGDRSLALEQWHARREDALRDAGIPFVALRAGGFMSNTFQWAGAIKREGVVYDAADGQKTAPIAARDIARVAVHALGTGALDGQAVQITGPEAMSVADQTAVLARVLGRPLRCVPITIDEAMAALAARGVTGDMAQALREMMERTRAGRGALVTDAVERLTGKKPVRFEEWASEHRAAFE